MRDFRASCFGDNALRIIAPLSPRSNIRNGGLNSVICCYRSILSTGKELIIKIIWEKSKNDIVGSIIVENYSSVNEDLKPNDSNTCQLSRRKKGSKSIITGNSVTSLHWDLSAAKYRSGMEPVKDFYVVLVADAEFGLLLGDKCKEFIQRFGHYMPTARFSVFSQKENVFGTSLHSTKCCFREDGEEHDILIRFKGDELDDKESEIYICVDNKKAINVQKLHWNFRGNETIFVEGAAVDVMWDTSDWSFCRGSRSAIFVFRTRSALESRLWSDEEIAQGATVFSLSIRAFKSREKM